MKYKLILLFLFIVLFLRFIYSIVTSVTYQDGQSVKFTTQLFSEPQVQGNFKTISVNLPHTFPPQRATVMMPYGSAIEYGDRISISGKVKYTVLKNNKTVLTVYSLKTSLNENNSNFFLRYIAQLRKNIGRLYSSILDPKSSSLLLGIVFGIKQNVSKDFSQNLRNTGVVHVIAASGMNVTMVAAFLMTLTKRFFKRQAALIISLSGVLFYAIFSGLQPSIVRAAIMGSLAFSSQLFGRQYSGGYALGITGVSMLLLEPGLLFDIGFELSFLSTLGILYIQPLLPTKTFLTDDIKTTIAAQLSTIPIMLLYFGQYSLLSVFVNALVLWTIPLLMILGGFGAIIGLLVPFGGTVLLYLALPFLWYFVTIVEFFGKLQWNLQILNVSALFIIGYYLLLLSIVLVVSRKEERVL